MISQNVTVHLRNLKIAPRKARLVADLVRKMSPSRAVVALSFTEKRSSRPFSKLINSAITIATREKKLDLESLAIERLIVNEGRKLKRMRPAPKGRSAPYWKRYCHISLILRGRSEANLNEKQKENKKADKVSKKENKS